MAKRKRTGGAKRTTGAVTEEAIRKLVGPRNFSAGEDYFASGAIYDCRREGSVFRARCEGQSANVYHVRARIQGNVVDQTTCSCPVGTGGHCKHMAAMLLTWMHQPHKFKTIEPVEKRLVGCSKEQLIRLLKQMLEQKPELESWLELALPASSVAGEDVKLDAYRQQAIAAFKSVDEEDWDVERKIAASLKAIVKIGDQLCGQDKFASAASVYCGILEGILQEDANVDDDSGDISLVAGECFEMLDLCLPHLAENSAARQLTLQTLFNVIRYDVNSGGIGLSTPLPDIFQRHATDDERALLVRWIREKSSESGRPLSSWEREYWDSLLRDWRGDET